MGFEYLQGKNWKEITRDERYFCAELFFEIKHDTLSFVKWLSEKGVCKISDDEFNNQWEIGFEVCFYRDYILMFGDDTGEKSISKTSYSPKRTFDLCLFSEKRIIIIEAKAQQGFKTNQNEEFLNDISQMMGLLKKNSNNFNVSVIALASSIYFENVKKHGNGLPAVFQGNYFSWKDIYESFSRRSIFEYADKSYKN